MLTEGEEEKFEIKIKILNEVQITRNQVGVRSIWLCFPYLPFVPLKL